MRCEIEDMLKRLEQDVDLGNDDVSLQLGLLLERNRGIETASHLLSERLRFVELSECDEKAIIERVASLIERRLDSGRRHLFWILSKASPDQLLAPLVILVHGQWPSFDEETAVQAVFALNNCLGNETGLAENSALLREHDVTAFLERMNTPKMSFRTNVVSRDLEKVRKAMKES